MRFSGCVVTKTWNSWSCDCLRKEGGEAFTLANAGVTTASGQGRTWCPWVYENVSVMCIPDYKLWQNRVSQAFWSQMLWVPSDINFPHLPLHCGPIFLPLLGPIWGSTRGGWQWGDSLKPCTLPAPGCQSQNKAASDHGPCVSHSSLRTW